MVGKKMKIEKIIAGLLIAVPLIAGCEGRTQKSYIDNRTDSPQTQVETPAEQKGGNTTHYQKVEIKDLKTNPAKYYGSNIEVSGVPTSVNSAAFTNNVGFGFSLNGQKTEPIMPYDSETETNKNWMVCQRNYSHPTCGFSAISVVQTAHENDLEVIIKGKFIKEGVISVDYVSGLGYSIWLYSK